ncbi:beta strand repeat-containing protein [Herbaspirillum lusitanum]|uniref:beta strand repeat-containing protein n=1 Tax=Herbaspirillum lusitanum TaxID=213312 RepID=UPI0022389CBB|nr:filamentous hemagglutinin N-terminal domain-containing protein [Herbaspirillum lusitanum]
MSEKNQARPANPAQDFNRIELMPASVTMRVGNRRLTMSWRPRKPMPPLLTGLLQRSWRAMFGKSLRMSVTAAAICAAWNMPAMAAAPGVNTLPTGGVITAGTATIAQNGNTLNINQSSSAAIGNFTSFSIGANAVVDIRQTNAANAFLARVTGSDPTQIYGLLKSNGTVMLVNQNGLMVGPGGVVDVARFIGSTLNIRDSDFLAGRLNFTDDGHAGNIDNQGTIKSATGGSVYLIGANVANNGIIHSPNGEVLLAAGQTVQLVDTATPGVTVCVTGAAGSVTNLGAITAEAGRIGIAAGLVTNSGNINASSVVSEGGRIFLRASQKLTTTASSKITADGVTKGGSVVLYSDGAAFIDGDVSARGAPGLGGFVETSGKRSLDVIKAPDVGTGGEWLIDPYDLTVVATGTAAVSNSGYVITSTGSSATIEAGTIVTQLNQGNSVTLTTGAGGAANGGNITVNAAINKTAGSASALTLNADNNILINADITSTGTYGLSLNLNSNYQGATTGDHTVQVTGATITPNTGIINVNEGVAGSGNGKIALNAGATIDLNVGSTLNAASLNISAGATIKSNYSTSVHLTSLKNAGEVNISNSAITTGALDNQVGGLVKLTNVSGALGGLTNAGTLNLTSVFQGGGITSGDITNTGTLTLSNGSTLNAGTLNNLGSTTLNASTLNVNGLTNAVGASVTLSDSALSASDIVHNAGTFITTNSTINTVNGMTNMVSGVLTMNYLSKISSGSFNNQGLLNAYGSAGYVTFENGFTNSGLMNLKGSIMANSSATNAQGGTLNLGAAGEASTISGSGLWGNDGTLNILGAGNEVTLGGTLMNNQTGTMLLSGTGTFLNAGQFSNSGIVTLGSGGSVTVGGSVSNSGSLLLSGANLASNGFSNEEGGTVSGTGSITVGGGSGVFTNNGILSPGGDNAVGSLSILGNLMLGNKGTLKLDFSSATNYDKITVLGSTLGLGGTLITKLLDTYRPAVGTTFTPIEGATSSSGSFRYVEGDIVTSGGVKNMIKAGYNLEGGQSGIDALRLTMSAPEEITYTGFQESQWSDINNWSSHYIPTAIDSIIIPSDRAATYAGVRPESLEKITVSSGGSFGMTTGDLTVNTIRSEGNFSVGGGALTLLGTGRLYSLSLGGTLNGGSTSILNVTDSFQQYGGSINSAGDVALSQADGDLIVGSITARNLALEAQTGSVGQQDTALHVTKQLLTSSATGTTLTSSNNRIAAFAGNNRVSGDIMLVNNLESADTSVVKINGVSNANGNINIVNTGGAATAAIGSDADFLGSIPTESGTPISAAVRLATLGINTSGLMSVAGTGSSVNLETHSPLTIGAGGVSATGNINLTAGNSGSASDNLVVNGVIASTGGNIALLAGNNMSINANITTAAPGTALFTVTNGVLTYAPGVSITDASGTVVPVAAIVNQIINSTPPAVAIQFINSTSPSLVSQLIEAPSLPIKSELVKTVQKPLAQNINVITPVFAPATSSVSTPANTQTTGGTQGTFGGDDTGTSTPATGGTANTAKKPLPVCT